jgi:hypothetical protein
MGLFNRKKTTTTTTNGDRFMTGQQAQQLRHDTALNQAVHNAARDRVLATKDSADALRNGDLATAASRAADAFEADTRLAHAQQERCGKHTHN